MSFPEGSVSHAGKLETIQESLPYKRGVAEAKAAVVDLSNSRNSTGQLVDSHCEELMPCGCCVHALGHAHGCPDLVEN